MLALISKLLTKVFFNFSGHNDCPVCGVSFTASSCGRNARRSFENHMKTHNQPKIKDYTCRFCNKDKKFKSKLDRHLESCKKKNKEWLENPKKKNKLRKESSTATWIVKKEKNDKPPIMYEKKTSKKETKELSTWILKGEIRDTSQITAQITAKSPEFILPNVSLPSKDVTFVIKTSNEQS